MAFLKLASHRLRKLRQLSVSSWLVLVRAVIYLPVVAAALRIGGFQRVFSFLARFDHPAMPIRSAWNISHAQATANIVKIAARHGLYRANCLSESLTLCSLLRKRGARVELRIGTRKPENQLEAHAWVELDGIVLNDTQDVDERFTSFKQPMFPVGSKLK